MSAQYSPRHPHEPEIPPALDEDGRCRVCLLLVARDEAVRAVRRLAEIHHATIRPSDLHDPQHRDWTECKAESCRLAQSFGEQSSEGGPCVRHP